MPEGRDLALMLLSPGRAAHDVSLEKTILAIPAEDAMVTLSSGDGELRLMGHITGLGFKTAKIVLNRNPSLPVYKAGFNQTICELKEPGEISAVWKPATRNFEPCLIALNPPILTSFNTTSFFLPYDDLAEHLGAPLKTIIPARSRIM